MLEDFLLTLFVIFLFAPYLIIGIMLIVEVVSVIKKWVKKQKMKKSRYWDEVTKEDMHQKNK